MSLVEKGSPSDFAPKALVPTNLAQRGRAFIAAQKAGSLKPDNWTDIINTALDAYLP